MENSKKRIIYKVSGDLNSYEIIQNVYEDLKNYIQDDYTHLVISFEQVNAINSSAIGKILFLNNLISAKNGKISFIHLNENLKKLFKILLIDKLFKIYESEDEIED